MKFSTQRDLVFLAVFGGGFISGMIWNAYMIGAGR